MVAGGDSIIDDWDNIVISKNGASEDDTHIYNNAVINISFPIKPKFSYCANEYGNDYVYTYTANYEGQDFGLVLEKHYSLAKYYGGIAYGCVETKSYEEIIKEIKEKPYPFLESCLSGFIHKLIKKEDCDYVIKRRFSRNGCNVIEYFAKNAKLLDNKSFLKGQLFLFGDDMLLSHLYVTSKTKDVFNEDYYRFFVNSFRCHLNIKDYLLERGKDLEIKTQKAKEKIGNLLSRLKNKNK